MYNFDPYNVFLAIATNIPQRLKTAFVLQGHTCVDFDVRDNRRWSFLLEDALLWIMIFYPEAKVYS